MTDAELVAEHRVELDVIATNHDMQAVIDATNWLIAEYGEPNESVIIDGRDVFGAAVDVGGLYGKASRAT